MIDLRVRSRVHPDELEQKVGKIVTDADYNAMLTGPCRVRRPDGQLLCVYLPEAIPEELAVASWPLLHQLKPLLTDNRGLASGSERIHRTAADGSLDTRSRSKKVSSSLLGAFEPQGPKVFCRQTGWTSKNLEKWQQMFPLWGHLGDVFAAQVPERYRQQREWADKTEPVWVIPGTPFTTVTVNNTYPTGVHVDQGDLDVGFSVLATLLDGEVHGGVLTFPEYRVGVQMKHRDVLLMNAHEWHGNTKMAPVDGGERISVVCYFRTKVQACGTYDEEVQKAQASKLVR